jgi:hypothetical protein
MGGNEMEDAMESAECFRSENQAETMKEERRKTPRVPLLGNAIIYLGNSSLQCTTLDLGSTGIGLACPFPSEPGTKVQVDFTLPKVPRWVSVKAVVARIGESSSGRVWGLKFRNVHQKTAGLIKSYIEEQLST